MHLLLSTIEFRWYVFFFWGVGLFALSRALGFPGALLRFLLGYGVAYLFEWSSAHPGGWFPFGHYRYLPTTASKEIWVGLLPLMDSLSFAFLAVGSLGVVAFFSGRTLGETLHLPWVTCWESLFRAAILFMLIDMVIDPVALRGNRWFLGHIYEYPDGGAYFGVTISNFIGWFVTGAALLLLWKAIPLGRRAVPSPKLEALRSRKLFVDRFLPSFIYGAVYLFNFSVAVYLQEWGIVGADLALLPVIGVAASPWIGQKIFSR